MTASPHRFEMPTQVQLVLPLLDTLRELGGAAPASKVIDAVTERLHVPPEVRDRRVVHHWAKWGTRVRYPWRQALHWARHIAVTRDLLKRGKAGYWELSERGSDDLLKCQPGVILVVYETPNGQALWADAITAVGALRHGSVNLLFTSPPYPLAGAGRKYGNLTEAETVELIMKCAPGWYDSLADDGSLVLNLKDCWLPRDVANGSAVRSLYIEKILLGLCSEAKFHLADKHYWRNPACGPTTPWVTRLKVRCTDDIETVLWLSKNGRPYADTTQVMRPAKPSTIATYKARARRGQVSRIGPSGQNNVYEEQMAKVAAGEELMVLPRRVQEIPNSDRQDKLRGLIRKAGLPVHPATMPLDLARFWVRMTTRKGDHCHDPFCGWGGLGFVCEQEERTFSISDSSLAYLVGPSYRFNPQMVSFE